MAWSRDLGRPPVDARAAAATPARRRVLQSLDCVIEEAEIRRAQLDHRVRRFTQGREFPILPLDQAPPLDVDRMPLGGCPPMLAEPVSPGGPTARAWAHRAYPSAA